MSKVVLSIITVCYNCQKDLKKTFDSMIEQLSHIDCSNIEYIVIDGKSEDGTVNLASEMLSDLERIGIKTFLLSERDNGIYDAMNKGIRYATGKWIYMLNAGDTFYTEYTLKHVIEKLKVSNADVVYGDSCRVNPYYSEIRKPGDLICIEKTMILCHQAIFIKNEVMQKFKYDTVFKYCADYDLVLRLYLEKYIFDYFDECIVNYSLSGVSAETGMIDAYKEIFNIRLKYGIIQSNFRQKIKINLGVAKRYLLKKFPPNIRWKIVGIIHRIKK